MLGCLMYMIGADFDVEKIQKQRKIFIDEGII